MSRILDKAIAVGLLVVVIFTALAFGSNEPWSVGLFQLMIGVLLLMWVVKCVADKRVKITLPALALPILGLFALGLAQSIAYIGSDGRIRSLSMDVEATRGATLMLFFLLASFIIARNFFVTRERLGAMANVLIVYGLAMSVFALMQYFTWDGRIYWTRPTPWVVAFGPFANRNHYAGYMEMLALLPLALILARGVRKASWVFYGFAASIMSLSIFISLSRGGMVGLMAGMAFVLVMSARFGRRTRVKGESRLIVERSGSGLKRTGAVVVCAIVIAAGIFWIGAEGLVNRAAQSIDQMKASNDKASLFYRQEIWKDTLKLFKANPVVGAGLGAYETVFPIYARHDGLFVVNYAHNDYLQALSDGGIIGFGLALLFIVLLFRTVARSLKSEDPLLAGLALGCGAGVFSILVHSMFDFNLQIPSNALLFLFLSAVLSRIAAGVDESKAEGLVNTKASGYATGV
ncbi:MAG: O-antigen ligase family protein [Blastocatellia bacterium]